MAESSPNLQTSQEGSTLTSPTFAKPTTPVRNPSKLKATSFPDFEESFRPGKRPRLEPPQMTAAAAVAEARRKSPQLTTPPSTGTSPNRPRQALNALMSSPQNATSKAPPATSAAFSDPATIVSEALAVVAENIQPPTSGEAT